MAVQELGGYRLLNELGSGGMGVVHLGVDAENNPVAVKVLHAHIANDETARKRLAREVRTLRRIKHPRIAAVLDDQLRSESASQQARSGLAFSHDDRFTIKK